jgi:hypothetical protein
MPWSNKEKAYAYMAKWRNNLYSKRDEIFGNKCIICASNRSLVLHRKDGTPHKEDSSRLIVIAIKNPEEWGRVCYSCHKGIHWCMKFFGWKWEEILSHFK